MAYMKILNDTIDEINTMLKKTPIGAAGPNEEIELMRTVASMFKSTLNDVPPFQLVPNNGYFEVELVVAPTVPYQ